VFEPTAATLGGRASELSVPWILFLAGLCLPVAAGCGSIAAQSRNAEGVRLFEQGRYQESIAQFEKAINSDPKNADGYHNLAEVYHRLGVTNRDPSHLAQAEQHYNRCLDRDENHRQCYRGLAVLLVEQERSEEAFRLIEGWVDRNPAAAEPKIELARLLEEFGDRQAAKERLLEALSADPQNACALAALGRLREQMGEHALALHNYQQSLWHDRFQPEVAARVATLQSSLPATGAPLPGSPGGTRIVTRNAAPLR
jgi:tetratricopeptide (TPR) repeat protein